MSHTPISISPLSFCPRGQSNDASFPMVWFDGASHFDHGANLPATEGFEFGDRSEFKTSCQDVAARHPLPSARSNTASLRRPTNPLRGFDGRRLARVNCSPPSIPLAPLAFDAAFACSAALHGPLLHLIAIPCKAIPGGSL